MDKILFNKVKAVLLALTSEQGFTHEGTTYLLDEDYTLFARAQKLRPGFPPETCYVRVLGEFDVRTMVEWAKALTDAEVFMLSASRVIAENNRSKR